MYIIREWIDDEDGTQNIVGIYDNFHNAINDLQLKIKHLNVFDSAIDEYNEKCSVYACDVNGCCVDYDIWRIEKNFML